MSIYSSSNIQTFFELLRAGLWEKDARLSQYKDIDFSAIMRLAEEQSVVGLVAAGLEHVVDVKVPQTWALQFAGQTIQLEQRNKAMNHFVGSLVEKMRSIGIYALLIKGQGIAQCYERPMWRACGDVDFYLSDSNYEEAKTFLIPLAHHIESENTDRLHLGMTIDSWIVELHGSMHADLSRIINNGLDEVHKSIFNGGEVRSWNNDGTIVFLPSADNDIIIVFTHILQHFFVEGIGLRQICDWCRLLWTYRESLNHSLLESRIWKMGLMTEWKAFTALAVDNLGIPKEVMPFYDDAKKWKNKGLRILSLILETGTFGHNRDLSYKERYSFLQRLITSFKRRNSDSWRQISIFPLDGLRMWWKMIALGVGVAVKGK